MVKVFTVILGLFIVACGSKKDEEEASTFTDVHATLKGKCMTCHVAGGEYQTSGGANFILTGDKAADHAVVTNAAFGLINTAQPENSALVVTGSSATGHTGGNQLGAEKDTFISWIEAGAKND